jgi:hypothetical protein
MIEHERCALFAHGVSVHFQLFIFVAHCEFNLSFLRPESVGWLELF